MKSELASGKESAFAFQCEGKNLIGFLHGGDDACTLGVLTLVAGGPQYRGGVGRQLLRLGRRLAAEGMPVMRFDHRGLGDSEGSFRGFRFLYDDIAAAIAEFKVRAPAVKRLILWGGCDSATAALINAWKLPEVVCVIAGNPFVSTTASVSTVRRKHYVTRLRQRSFWLKLLRFQYNPFAYASGLFKTLKGKMTRAQGHGGQGEIAVPAIDDSFINELLTGLENFDGKILFLMGDRFLLSDEFNELVASTPRWQRAYARRDFERIDIVGGDQVFSTQSSQDQMFDIASEWIQRNFVHTDNCLEGDLSTVTTPPQGFKAAGVQVS